MTFQTFSFALMCVSVLYLSTLVSHLNLQHLAGLSLSVFLSLSLYACLSVSVTQCHVTLLISQKRMLMIIQNNEIQSYGQTMILNTKTNISLLTQILINNLV